MKYKLADICTKIGSGATPRGGKGSYCENGISLVRSQNVLDFSFSPNGLAYISKEQAEKLNNVELTENDVLLNITGDSVARTCMMDIAYLPARVNQHVAIIRGNPDKVFNSFLLYYLQWQKKYLLQLASTGGTRNALTKGMIEQLVINLPPLEQQKKVISILDLLQAKIELNQKINENLEQQARAIFKSWFIDYEPFDYRQPSDWVQGTVDDLASEIVCGKTPSTKKKEYYGSDVPFITIPDMHGTVYALKTERSLSALGAESQSKKTLPANSVAVSCIGTAGLVSLIPIPSQTNQQINSIIPKVGISSFYVYLLMQTMSETINKLGQSGSTIVNLNKTQFGKMQAMIPSAAVMSEFDTLISPVFSMILVNQQENERLVMLRDTLLPELMYGRIDVSAIQL